MRNEFTAVIERNGDRFIAWSPEIPGANGQGRSVEECRENLGAAIQLILNDRRSEQSTTGSDTTEFKPRFERLGPGPFSPAEAGSRIRELRKNNLLDGLKIKNLIEEGRRI